MEAYQEYLTRKICAYGKIFPAPRVSDLGDSVQSPPEVVIDDRRRKHLVPLLSLSAFRRTDLSAAELEIPINSSSATSGNGFW